MGAKKGAVLMSLLLVGVYAWWGLPSWAGTVDAGGAARGQCSGVKPLPPPSYASFFGRQRPVEGESREWRIRLAAWSPSKWPPQRFTFSVKNNITGATYRLTFPGWASPSRSLRVAQVDEIDPLGHDRALILGRLDANLPVANVVALPSGALLDHFLCLWPALSPDKRFLAFVKPFPGHPGPVSITNEYLIYDLARGPAYNRPHFKPGRVYGAGWPIYPPGATNAAGENMVPGLAAPGHRLSSSRLFWLGPATLAFTDYYDGVDRLVVARIPRGIRAPVVHTVALRPSEILDLGRCKKAIAPSDFSRWSRDPAALIQVTQISPAPAEAGAACLFFSARLEPSSCFRVTNLKVGLP